MSDLTKELLQDFHHRSSYRRKGDLAMSAIIHHWVLLSFTEKGDAKIDCGEKSSVTSNFIMLACYSNLATL